MTRVNGAAARLVGVLVLCALVCGDSAIAQTPPLYLCVRPSGSEPLPLSASVEALCRRHPEMGPCKYERNACRKSGGRVFLASGEEITATTEAAYDKRVQRFSLQADGPTRRPAQR